MFTTLVSRCRRRLASSGLMPSPGGAAMLAMADGDAEIRPARLLEDPELRTRPVGEAEPFGETVAFLDGTQHTELLGCAGTMPLALAEVRAAVRERSGGAFTTAVRLRAAYLVGRRAALDRFGGAVPPLPPADPTADAEWTKLLAFSDEIQDEDIEICEAVQRNLRSRVYDRGRYSAARENGVHHFHSLLHEFLT